MSLNKKTAFKMSKLTLLSQIFSQLDRQKFNSIKLALIILFLAVFPLSCKTTQTSMEKISLSGFFIKSFDKYGNCILFVESNFECIDSFLKYECLEVNNMPKMDTLNFFDAIKNISINSDSFDRVRYSTKVFEFKLNKNRNVANFYSNLKKNE